MWNCESIHRTFENTLILPEKYHEFEVELEGIFHYRFEDCSLYLTRDETRKQAVWVDFNNTLVAEQNLNALDGKRIRIKGTFDHRDKGHLNLFAAALKHASIVQ